VDGVDQFENGEAQAYKFIRGVTANSGQYMSHPIGLTLMGFSSFGDTLGRFMLPPLAMMALAGA
jgi:hypothetical protein